MPDRIRKTLTELCEAILAVNPPEDVRERAEALLDKLDPLGWLWRL
jgi:hypothetical protein